MEQTTEFLYAYRIHGQAITKIQYNSHACHSLSFSETNIIVSIYFFDCNFTSSLLLWSSCYQLYLTYLYLLMSRCSTRICGLHWRHSVVAEDSNGEKIAISKIDNERNVATNVYTNMDVESVNNSPEHIDGENEATTITKYHGWNRIVSQLPSPQQIQSNNTTTNIIETNMLDWHWTCHCTVLQQTRSFCNKTVLLYTPLGTKTNNTAPHRNKPDHNDRKCVLLYYIMLHQIDTHH